MACTIPLFNLAVKVIYDLTQSNPTITINNLSTGASVAGIKFWFVISTPSGVVFHEGSFGSPDATGAWTTVNIAETIPQLDGHIEFNNAIPFSVKVFAQDGSGNTCDKTYEDIICQPNASFGKTNYGGMYLNSTTNCNKGFLEVADQSNYQYQGITGNIISSTTKFIYPADINGSIPTPTTVNNKMAFMLPIPVNGKGHQLTRTAKWRYVYPNTQNEILINYKYSKVDIEINCGIDLCSINCGLSKYRKKLEECTSCQSEKDAKLTDLALKISQLSLAVASPLCGLDISAMQEEIKDVLLINDCYCDDCGQPGNNPTFTLKCADIDIECVSTEIINLINADAQVKASWCTVVNQCVAGAPGGCSVPVITGVVSNSTQISVNFILPVQGTSQNLEVFYKLASSGTWITAGVVPSNSTSVLINGSFTPGDLYQVKVTNHCSGNINVDSSVISTNVITSVTQCSLLSEIYNGFSSGLYVVKVDTNETGCNKYAPTPLSKELMSAFLPCSIPLNFKVSSSGVLSWTGVADSDYRISYKLKTDLSFTVHTTDNFPNSDSTYDIVTQASLPSPVQNYDFRIEKSCNGGAELSQPVYCSFDTAATSGCKSPSGFIEWNESNGLLKFYGGVSGGTYIASAYNITTGTALAAPTSVTVDANGIITANYANILSSGTSIGDKVTFSVKTDCGSGVYSESVSFTYKRIGVLTNCPQQTVTFNPSTMVAVGKTSGNRIELKINSGALLTTTKRMLFRMKIGSDEVYSGEVLAIDGGSTFIESPIDLKNGDNVQFSIKTFCNCCDNYTSESAWSSWFGGAISIINGWDDEWYALPGSGFLLNSFISSPTYNSKFKIDKDGNIHLRGALRKVFTTINTGTTAINLGVMDLTGGTILSSAKNSIISSPDYDTFPAPAVLVPGTSFDNPVFTRNGNTISLSGTLVNNTGSAISNGALEIGIGHIILR